MAIVELNSAHNAATANGTTASVTVTATTAGNACFAIINIGTNATVSGPAGWTRDKTIQNGTSQQLELWSNTNIGAGLTSFSWTGWSTNGWAVAYEEVSGLTNATLVGVTASTTGTPSPMDTGTTATSAQATGIFIGGHGYNSGAAVTLGTPSNSFNRQAVADCSGATTNPHAILLSLIIASAQTGDTTETQSTNKIWTGVIGFYQSAGAANPQTAVGGSINPGPTWRRHFWMGRLHTPLPAPSSSGPQSYQQSLSASLSFTGSMTKAPAKSLSAGLSFTGTGKGFQIGPGLFTGTQTQTGISGGPPGNNGTETWVEYRDGSGNGWRVGMDPAYGAALVGPWYEIAAGVVTITQTSLQTSSPDGFLHVLAQTTGAAFSGTEDPTYTLVENAPIPATPGGVNVRRYYDSGTITPSSGPALNYRVRTVIQPGDPGLLFTRIDITNPSGTPVTLASSDSLEVAMIGGLTQVQQGSANPAWAPANGRYALVGGTETAWPTSLTTVNPDYVYCDPAAGSGLTLSPFCVKKTGLVEAASVTSGQIQYLQNGNRLKLKLQGTLNSFPASTTYTCYWIQGFRRNRAAGEINSIAADLLNPDGAGAFSVGTFSSYSYDEGAYVVAAASNAVSVTHTFTAPVTKRWLPSYKITGYTATGSPKVTLAGTGLVWGTDYISVVDTAAQIAYVKLLKGLVASGAGAGELNNGLLSISPGGPLSQALSAALSFTGSLVRSVSKGLAAATLSFTGSQSRAANKGLAGAALSFTGSIIHGLALSKSLTAVLSFTGSQVRLPGKAFAAVLSFTGSQGRQLAKGLGPTALSFTGSLKRATARSLVTGVLSFTGTILHGNQFSKALNATLSFTGSQARLVGKTLVAGLSFTGSAARSIAIKLASAALGFTGSITSAQGGLGTVLRFFVDTSKPATSIADAEPPTSVTDSEPPTSLDTSIKGK